MCRQVKMFYCVVAAMKKILKPVQGKFPSYVINMNINLDLAI